MEAQRKAAHEVVSLTLKPKYISKLSVAVIMVGSIHSSTLVPDGRE